MIDKHCRLNGHDSEQPPGEISEGQEAGGHAVLGSQSVGHDLAADNNKSN